MTSISAIYLKRLSYHDVLRVKNIQNYFDIGGIQPYVINNFKVVFLNKRNFDKIRLGVGKSFKHTYLYEFVTFNNYFSLRLVNIPLVPKKATLCY